MPKLVQKTYCGSVEGLKGKTALVMDAPVTSEGTTTPMLLAQFDDLELSVDLDGSGVKTLMAFGWHLFEPKEFN